MFETSRGLCMCTVCQVKYRSCCLFKEHQVTSESFTPASLRSSVLSPIQIGEKLDELVDEEDNLGDAITTGDSVVAPATLLGSIDTVWLADIVEMNYISYTKESTNDYGHIILAGMRFLRGHFLECIITARVNNCLPIKECYIFLQRDSSVFIAGDRRGLKWCA